MDSMTAEDTMGKQCRCKEYHKVIKTTKKKETIDRPSIIARGMWMSQRREGSTTDPITVLHHERGKELAR